MEAFAVFALKNCFLFSSALIPSFTSFDSFGFALKNSSLPVALDFSLGLSAVILDFSVLSCATPFVIGGLTSGATRGLGLNDSAAAVFFAPILV